MQEKSQVENSFKEDSGMVGGHAGCGEISSPD
jgi:hypothetical protein